MPRQAREEYWTSQMPLEPGGREAPSPARPKSTAGLPKLLGAALQLQQAAEPLFDREAEVVAEQCCSVRDTVRICHGSLRSFK